MNNKNEINNRIEKKTIQINPELFKISNRGKKNKTQKAEKKELVINDNLKVNNLTSKLLKRIRDTKNKELKKYHNKNFNNLDENNNINENNIDENNNDEFLNAINFLNTLSKEKNIANIHNNYKVNTNRNINNNNNQNNYKKSGNNKTLKNYSNLYVHNDLPNDLFNNKNYQNNKEPPFGNLKNGTKPTYRSYMKTMKNISGEIDENDEIENILNNYIRPPTPPKRNNLDFIDEESKIQLNKFQNDENNNYTLLREQKLASIKEKLQKLQDNKTTFNLNNDNNEYENYDNNDNNNENNNNENNNKNTLEDSLNNEINISEFKIENDGYKSLSNYFEDKIFNKKSSNNFEIKEEQDKNGGNSGNEYKKQFIKKTIKKKYNLGKQKNSKKVGILIKNNKSRKNILDAQKELKKVHINTVKKYLKKKGFIKVGSNAPNDVLRKTFESLILSGDINNKNTDVLLHNFMNTNENEN